jgi:hypothetical protein
VKFQTVRDLFLSMRKQGPEYFRVLHRMSANDYAFPDLIEAHLTPCTEDQARAIFNGLKGVMQVDMKFGARAGVCHFNDKTGRYLISLPPERTGRLRVGIVIHEFAHVVDHIKRGKFGHGWQFVRAFEHLLTEFPWRKLMPDGNKIDIFMRHRGKFSLVLTVPKGSKTARVEGLNAERAHNEAIALVTTGDATEVYVYSDSEGCFIGAFYKRGIEYRSWEDELAAYHSRLELSDERPTPTLLQGGPEPVRPVDDPDDERVQAGPVPGDGPVRDVPAKAAAKPRAVRTPPAPKARVGLTIGEDDGWPKSEAAQAIHSLFGRVEDGKVLTSPEICAALAPRLAELGVQFPASLVSRLKQNGFLKEKRA